jgi:glucose/arabinose dehydrogenase
MSMLMLRSNSLLRGRNRWVALGAVFVTILTTFSIVPRSAEAAVDPIPLPGFQDEVVLSGLTNPTTLRFANDGRVFVAEKSGMIKVFDNLSDPTPTVFADLRTKVHNFWDRGMLGLELHPNFPTTPFLYVAYTHDAAIGQNAPRWGSPGSTSDPCPNPPGSTQDGCLASGRLSRLQASGNVMTGSEQVFIEDWCIQYPSHSVGDLEFGPDGNLYMTGGDGASFSFIDYGQAGSPKNPCGDPPSGVGGTQTPPTAEGGALRSQDLRTRTDPATLGGAVLRLDPNTGAGLPSNPFGSSSDANERRIIGYGLRNPFRMAFRPGTDQIYLGDVGYRTFEEINVIPDANDPDFDNFGWPCYEGSPKQTGYDNLDLNICEDLYDDSGAARNPLFQYRHEMPAHSGDNCKTGTSSTTGVAFYEGGNYPSEYDGAMFMADYARDCIWVMRAGANGAPDPSTVTNFVEDAAGPVDLVIGPGGDLFYPAFNNGTIRRISFGGGGGNSPPVADIVANPPNGPPPLTVALDGRGSSDPDDDPLTYSWDLNDDGIFGDATTAQTNAVFNDAGSHRVRLRVTDTEGATDTDSIDIIVSDPPTATIGTPTSALRWRVGDTIAFSGSATDPQDGNLPASALSWTLILHHCTSETECHQHSVQDFEGVSSGSFSAPDHPYPSHLELRLTATDSDGLTDSQSLQLDPQTATVTMQSNPPGLELVIDDVRRVAPFTTTVIRGSNNSISAPSPQAMAGDNYAFDSWSDGGARSHDVVIDANTTLTANYGVTEPPEELFGSPSFYSTGTEPHSVEAGDFDGDGRPDLVTGNSATNDVSLLLGRPDGSFAPERRFAAGNRPKYATIGDFNEDGDLDVASANEGANTVTILRGNGDGTLQAPLPGNPACRKPHEVRAADLNADGNIDLVVSCWRDSDVDVLLGRGDGTFQPRATYIAGPHPNSTAIGDVNGDGHNDLAVATHDQNAITVMLNQGNGTFGTATAFAVDGRPHQIRTADLNGDGDLDLATANDTRDRVSVLLGNGDGTFDPHSSYDTGNIPKSLFVADLDGDGNKDIVTASSGGYPTPTETPSVGVHLGRGNGDFDPVVNFAAGPNPFSVIASDFNSDGRLDIAVSNFKVNSNAGILLNGSGASDTTPPSLTARSPSPGATNVATTSNVTATFSEPVDPATISFTLENSSGQTVAASTSYDAGTRIATLDPASNLNPNATYTARMSGAEDLAGNTMAAVSWSFTTATADTTPPTVTARAPSPGATGVARTTNATATFSEAVDPGTIAFTLENSSGQTVGASTSYNASTRTVTLDPSATLLANHTYTARLSGAKDLAGNTMAAVTWSFTTADVSSSTTYLSDLAWASVKNGWGPVELDTSNGEKVAGDGNPITLNGVVYPKGLGTHSNSEIVYNLGGNYTSFSSYVGIDDEVGTGGSAIFRVRVDGVVRFDSGIMTGSSPTQLASVDLTGANQLMLEVNLADGTKTQDHGDWADAVLIGGS